MSAVQQVTSNIYPSLSYDDAPAAIEFLFLGIADRVTLLLLLDVFFSGVGVACYSTLFGCWFSFLIGRVDVTG